MSRRFPLLLGLALGLLGCGGAFGDAIERGDALARAGQWDQAAQSYEQAVAMEPGDAEARARLAEARRGQAAVRVAAAWTMLERGDIAGAVATVQDAVRLNPASPAVQRALTNVNARALERAEALLAAHQAREALDLALLVRRAAPADPRAIAVEGRAREELAAAAYARGEGLLAQSKRGNALLAFAEATRFLPGYRDAAARAGAIRREIEAELRFYAVIDPAAAGDAADLARAATLDLRDAPTDRARPLLSVVDRAPSPEAIGIRLGVRLDGYRAAHDVRTEQRHCGYVCGVDRLPNPELRAASLAAAGAERRSAAADAEASRARNAADRRRRESLQKDGDAEVKGKELERARTELEACRARPAARRAHEPCGPEEKRVRSAETENDAAVAAAASARTALGIAEETARGAVAAQAEARAAWDQAVATVARTSPTLDVERTCEHTYAASIHTAREEVSLILRAGVLGEGAPAELPPVRYDVVRSDETFPAEPGRCAEVAAGDPLTLPGRQDLDRVLVEQVVAATRQSMQGSYDEYRRSFLEAERSERAAGRRDEAEEARVRWLLTGPDPAGDLTVAIVPASG